MAFDQATRARLQDFVADVRELLSDEFTQQLQNTYGIDPVTGGIAELCALPTLSPNEQQTATLLRDTLAHYLATSQKADPYKDKKLVIAALDRIVREQAFTVLNRLAALRMAEARQFVMESISRGYQSKGFQLYLRIAGSSLGDTSQAYQHYLFSVFDELTLDLAVLFDRYSSQGRLFPSETVLLELLALINHAELEPLWAEDETVGWIYQYFNSKEERKKMRDESQIPRNSRELAVRNQFFTPRYVVEFLTDNTLGRIWYEMTQGKTALVDSCKYLVQRPDEVFLEAGQVSPDQENVELSQEELLQQTSYIKHRPLKDPRDIKMLDPACGSMHFGLYAFDLFEQIYTEAWDIESEKGRGIFTKIDGSRQNKTLHAAYSSKDAFLADVPRLIIEHNIHGVDIDPRATQIAGLSLWLRAQKSWDDNAIKHIHRPQIRRSNIVCAEPMPGEKRLLKEFTSQLRPRVLGQLVEEVFDKMKLAGEAGTLLKIEEEIQTAIDDAKSQKDDNVLEVQGGLFGDNKWEVREGKRYYNFGDVSEDFWEKAEQLILSQLELYVETSIGPGSGKKRLFASDAGRGFAFIDLCRKKYDAVLMNPPFGALTSLSNEYSRKKYPLGYIDFYTAFIDRGLLLCKKNGLIGAITSRSNFALSSFMKWRKKRFLSDSKLLLTLDLGGGVLDDAMVETAAYVISNNGAEKSVSIIDARKVTDKKAELEKSLLDPSKVLVAYHSKFLRLPNSAIVYDQEATEIADGSLQRLDSIGVVVGGCATGDDSRFVRAFWEVGMDSIGMDRDKHWTFFSKGGEYSLFYASIHLLVDWREEGAYLGDLLYRKRPRNGYLWGPNSWSFEFMGKPGIFWSRKSQKGISFRYLPANCASSDKTCIFISNEKKNVSTLIGSLNTSDFTGRAKSYSSFGAYEKGTVSQLSVSLTESDSLEMCVQSAYEAVRNINSLFEVDPNFMPNIRFFQKRELGYRKNLKSYVDGLIEQYVAAIDSIERVHGVATECLEVGDNVLFLQDLASNYKFQYIVSELLGFTFGRWSLELFGDDTRGISSNSPLEPITLDRFCDIIDGAQILVHDDSDNRDVCSRIIAKLEDFCGPEAEAEFLSCVPGGDLQKYMTSPSGFFADHLKLYTRSKRAAPIFWPLQYPGCEYLLWINYKSISDETFFLCVNDFIDPKIISMEQDRSYLAKNPVRSPEEESEFSRVSEFLAGLQDFKDELLSVARLWKPNLNDGVQITAAPLWKLFQNKAWQKKLKKTWFDLEAGKYDWSKMAYNYWPERILRKCFEDRSLAIAHGVQEDLWNEVEIPASKGNKYKLVWQPKDISEKELSAFIQQKIEQG